MVEVEWLSRVSPDHVHGKLGCVRLHCRMVETQTRKKRWYGHIWIVGCNTNVPPGPTRHSLAKAQEDCVRLARETMIDYREGLREELKNFDLSMEQE